MKRFVGTILVILLAAVLLSAPAAAGDCYRSRQVYQSYSYTPSYSSPTYAPSYVPTYIKTYVSPDVYSNFYSSTSDYYRDNLLIQAIAGKVEEKSKQKEEITALKEELQLLRRQLVAPPPAYPPQQQYQMPYQPQQPYPQQQYMPPAYGCQGTQGGYQQQQQPQYQQPPPREQAPPRDQAPPSRKDRDDEPRKKSVSRPGKKLPDASPQLTAAVNQSCLRCHGASFEKDGDSLDLRDLNALDRETRLAVNAAMFDGRMPKGGKPLGDEITVEAHYWATGYKAQAAASQK